MKSNTDILPVEKSIKQPLMPSLFSAQKETKKPYPFLKNINQFKDITSFALPMPDKEVSSDDKAGHDEKDSKDSKQMPSFNTKQTENQHTTNTMTKKLKTGSSNEYSTRLWYEVKNPHVEEKCVARMNRMIVLTGELFRLLDGNQTKYRIVQDGDKQYPISKGIKGGKIFYDFFYDTLKKDFQRLGVTYIYIGNNFKQGMGRGFLGKYFYMDNDFHAENAFIDASDYFQVIDHNQCFWPWSRRLFKQDREQSSFFVSVRDYNSFPAIKDCHPNHWLGIQAGVAGYFSRLAREDFFNNEKHFAAIKLLVTEELQKYLVRFHIDDENDKNELLDILNSRFAFFNTVCQQSKPFTDYILGNKIKIMQAIIFELHDFFKSNKKYAEESVKWDVYVNQMIDRYSQLIESIFNKPLEASEKKDLNDYACRIFSDKVDAKMKAETISEIEKFYLSQGMKHFATLAKNERLALLPQDPASSVKPVGPFSLVKGM